MITGDRRRRAGPWNAGPVEDQVLADLVTTEDESQPRRWVASSRVVGEDAASLIRRLHRADDGFVRFLAKTSLGEMVPIKSIRASELHADLGKIANRLETDAYFRVNAPYRSDTTRTT